MHAGLSEAKTQISILGSRFVTIGRGGTIHVSDPGDTVGFARAGCIQLPDGQFRPVRTRRRG